MKHHATPDFWTAYDTLPAHIRQLADDNYALLKQNPRHPSLHFKRIGPYRSVRVGLNFRALGVDADGDIVWFWIGSHADYDRLVG